MEETFEREFRIDAVAISLFLSLVFSEFRPDNNSKNSDDHHRSLKMVIKRNTNHKRHLGLAEGSPKMSLNYTSILYLFGAVSLIFGVASAQTSGEQVKLPNAEDTSNKGYKLLLGTDKDSLSKVPNFFKSYGTLGLNYDIDRGQPFIWCEVSILSSCVY